MTTAVREVLKAFETLSPLEQREVVAEILRRSAPNGDLPLESFDELADELFRSYDAEEAARGKSKIPVRENRHPRKIAGLGQFRSGIPDLGSNKKHLKGFGA